MGDGPPLVLLHPSPQSGRVYWRLIRALRRSFEWSPLTRWVSGVPTLTDGITMPGLDATGDAMTALKLIDRTYLVFTPGIRLRSNRLTVAGSGGKVGIVGKPTV